MNAHAEPLDEASWIQGDYRYGAWIASTVTSIESLAQSIAAPITQFVEDGLGPGRTFGLRLPTGRQAAFEQYEGGVAGVSLLVLFENNLCSRAEIWEVLELFGIPKEQVTWVAPEAQ
jgi:hypothetical protein